MAARSGQTGCDLSAGHRTQARCALPHLGGPPLERLQRPAHSSGAVGVDLNQRGQAYLAKGGGLRRRRRCLPVRQAARPPRRSSECFCKFSCHTGGVLRSRGSPRLRLARICEPAFWPPPFRERAPGSRSAARSPSGGSPRPTARRPPSTWKSAHLTLRGGRNPFNDVRAWTFLTRVARDESGLVDIYALELDGRPLALVFALVCARGLLVYQTGYDAGPQAHRSPGQVLFKRLMEKMIRERQTLLDFSLGDEAYKSKWCDLHIGLHRTIHACSVAGICSGRHPQAEAGHQALAQGSSGCAREAASSAQADQVDAGASGFELATRCAAARQLAHADAAAAVVIAMTFWAGPLSIALARATSLRSDLTPGAAASLRAMPKVSPSA